jgi:4-amino-4-deoxy-L-arabinose transferase-like glycosyltransferase
MQSHETVGARAAFALDIPLIALSYVLLALLALVPRVLNLGSFVTVDEIAFWLPRADAFLRAIQAGNFPATAISTHPGVTTMWLGSAGVLLRRALLESGLLHDDSFATVLALYRLPVVLAHTVGILAGYALLRRMLPALVAALAALLWAADPFVIAYSRVLHVDGLAGTFITLSLLAACVYWFHDQRSRFLILSAISAGLAILSKSPALVLPPLVGLVALVANQDDGRWTMDDPEAKSSKSSIIYRLSSIVYRLSSIIRPLAVWAIVAAFTAIALWPALWAGPLQAIEQVRLGVVAEGAEPHMQGNFFLGRANDAPGLLFYPLALALRLTPWTLLGLLLLPIAWHHMRAIMPARRDLALLALYVLVFVAAMSMFPKKFNRYLEPVFPALDILAAVGLVGIGAWSLEIRRWRNLPPPISKLQSPVGGVLAGILVFAALANVAYWHPYEIAAYNQVLGGARAGSYAFLTGWGEGLEQAADWLNQQPDITGVRVATTQPGALQPYMRDGAQAVAASEQLPERTGYLVVYVRSTQGLVWSPFDQFYPAAVPLHVVQIHGVDYAWIYQAPPPITQPQPADFGDQIQLRGLRWDGAAQPGQPLALQLVWQVHAPPPADYMLFAHLIGPDGRRVAQADLSYPTSSWRAGHYATTDLPLALPADVPAGTYRLVIGLYDATNGQRLPLRAAAPIDPDLDGPDALVLTEVRVP